MAAADLQAPMNFQVLEPAKSRTRALCIHIFQLGPFLEELIFQRQPRVTRTIPPEAVQPVYQPLDIGDKYGEVRLSTWYGRSWDSCP